MINGYDIICISTSDWKRPWGSRQQIMTRLSDKNRVLFVEYQASFLHLFKYPKLFFRMFNAGMRKIKEDLIVYRPFLNLPFRYYSARINRLNQKFLLFQLRRLVKKLKFTNVILWIFEPTSCLLVGKFKEKISIYHCADSFVNEKKSLLRQKCIKSMEENLCDKCDVIFVSSQELLLEKSVFEKKAYLVQSAVDEDFFNKNLFLKSSVPKDLDKIAAPRIGFVGTIDDRIDYDLLEAVASERRDWNIVLLGEICSRNTRRLKSENIHILEWRDNKLIPAYIEGFDVCILPYKTNEFTRGISPIKVFEYLSLGKPVVSADLPDLKPLADSNLLRIAGNRRDFVKYIESYLACADPDIKNSRIEFARLNTWNKRVDYISKILEGGIYAKK